VLGRARARARRATRLAALAGGAGLGGRGHDERGLGGRLGGLDGGGGIGRDIRRGSLDPIGGLLRLLGGLLGLDGLRLDGLHLDGLGLDGRGLHLGGSLGEGSLGDGSPYGVVEGDVSVLVSGDQVHEFSFSALGGTRDAEGDGELLELGDLQGAETGAVRHAHVGVVGCVGHWVCSFPLVARVAYPGELIADTSDVGARWRRHARERKQ
jgi:hypothetical protein